MGVLLSHQLEKFRKLFLQFIFVMFININVIIPDNTTFFNLHKWNTREVILINVQFIENHFLINFHVFMKIYMQKMLNFICWFSNLLLKWLCTKFFPVWCFVFERFIQLWTRLYLERYLSFTINYLASTTRKRKA